MQQQMKLSPRMIQAMEILQLPLMALQERIDAEMEVNPVLEMSLSEPAELAGGPVEESQERGERALVVDQGHDNSEDFQRLAEFEAEYGAEFIPEASPPAQAPDPGDRDRKLDAMANTPAPAVSLNEYLLEQWIFVEAAAEIKQAGETILGNIDDDGYLRAPLEEMARQNPQPIAMPILREALRLVQTLEPIGVGARDLKECLLIQLGALAAAGSDVALETELVAHFLREIEMNHLPQIARKTNRSIEQIKSAIENLAKLNPHPGRLIGERPVPVIMPDVVVETDDDGQVVVYTPDGHTPRLHISRMYAKMSRDKATDRDARQFIQKSMRSAEWLMSAIEQRRHTVRRVTEEVFAFQREFLEHGPEALRPLPMADVAAKVGVHVATVSRAVAGKYVQTPKGIFPLRMFFSGGTTTAEGEDVSWDAVKVKLREVVDNEDKSNPLNDDELAAELGRHGITVARRTIAKYRGLLDIPPARKRRQY